MKTMTLVSGESVPAHGQGTWKMGVGDRNEVRQLKALEAGIDRGMMLIDTAEMYGEGRPEQLDLVNIARRPAAWCRSPSHKPADVPRFV